MTSRDELLTPDEPRVRAEGLKLTVLLGDENCTTTVCEANTELTILILAG